MFLRISRELQVICINRNIDPLPKYFHYIAFDEERNVFITLGDRNIVRVTISSDCRPS
jgi:hypothetical protein